MQRYGLFYTLLLKNKFQIPMSKSIPLIILERLYDFIGLLIVSVFGFILLRINFLVIISAFVLLVSIFLILKSEKIFYQIINLIQKLKFIL